MNSMEQNILMATTDIREILNNMGPARNNMAVVEPVAIPTPPEPPDMSMQPYQTRNEFDDMEIDDNVIMHWTNEAQEPMIDTEISIEEQEIEYPENQNTDWIENKILFN